MSDGQPPMDEPRDEQGLPEPPGAPGPYPPPGQHPPPGQYPPGTPPPQVVVVQQKSNTGTIIAIVVAVVLLLLCVPVIAILAVTFLGRSTSSKFVSVGSAVGDIRLQVDTLTPYLSYVQR